MDFDLKATCVGSDAGSHLVLKCWKPSRF